MGWNSWNHFGCSVTAGDVKRAADAIHANGMQELGYEYINVDDCWMSAERTSAGELMPSTSFLPTDDPTGNPSGWSTMKQIADYIHGLGLKFGLYEAGNSLTCGGRAGSRGHESTDAASFVAWGVDFLKYDSCRGNVSTPQAADYTQTDKWNDMSAMKNALETAIGTSTHKILYSINVLSGSANTDLLNPFVWNQISDMARVTSDIGNTWAYIPGTIAQAASQTANQKPGYFNDADMLEIGNLGSNTLNEDETQMVMWSMLQSPLLVGSDVPNLSQGDLDLITNQALLDLDKLAGDPTVRLTSSDATYADAGTGSVDFYVKRAPDNSLYVAAFNNGTTPTGWASVSIKNGALGLTSSARWTAVSGLSSYMTSYPNTTAAKMDGYVARHATALWHVTP
jgi:alpha-galactosidase